jgi:hypothetical protein
MSLVGRRFARWTVLEHVGSGPDRHALYRARCECGTEKIVQGKSMQNGASQSCGCLQRETVSQVEHGHNRRGKRSSEYRIWAGMIQRCDNPNRREYKWYGALGVKVCSRWYTFEKFLADMGPRPSIEHSLDRFPNPEGNYELSNCRWATDLEQGRNKRKKT